MNPKPLRPLTPAQQALASDPRALRLAETFAKIMASKAPRLAAEIHSAALYGLVEAARSFDPNRGIKFTTFAGPRIRGAIIDWMRDEEPAGYRRGWRARHPGEQRPFIMSADKDYQFRGEAGYDGGWDAPWTAQAITDPGPTPDARAARADTIRKLLRTLPKQHRLVVLLYYFNRDTPTMRQVGVWLGVNESRCSQMIGQATEWLREKANEPGFRETEMEAA